MKNYFWITFMFILFSCQVEVEIGPQNQVESPEKKRDKF